MEWWKWWPKQEHRVQPNTNRLLLQMIWKIVPPTFKLLHSPPLCYGGVCGSISLFILYLGAWNFITNSVKILSIFYLMIMINNTLFFAMKHSKRIFKEASAVIKLLLIREIMLFQSVLLVLLKCFGFFCPKLINMRQTFSMLVWKMLSFLHLLAKHGTLTSLSKSNHSEDSCGIFVNLRNAKSLIIPTV